MNGLIATQAPREPQPNGARRHRVLSTIYPLALYRQLDDLARRTDRKKGHLVRRAVEKMLADEAAEESSTR